VIHDQHDDRANHRYEQAVQTESALDAMPQPRKDEAPDNSPGNAKDEVKNKTLTLFVHDLAGDEPRN